MKTDKEYSDTIKREGLKWMSMPCLPPSMKLVSPVHRAEDNSEDRGQW